MPVPKKKEEVMPETKVRERGSESILTVDYPDMEDTKIPEHLKGGSDGMLERRMADDLGSEDELKKVKGREL